MSPDTVLQYLREHPEFFDTHAEAVAAIPIPHPESGRTISINERQLIALRERCAALEDRLAAWLDAGRANDQRNQQLHALVLRVLAAHGRPAQVAEVCAGLREVFGIPWVYLTESGIDINAWSTLVHDWTTPGCGPVAESQQARLSELAGHAIGSVAWVPVALGETGYALLFLGSEDETRFPLGTGTHYLQQVGEMLQTLLAD